jgi:hypothetical protein
MNMSVEAHCVYFPMIPSAIQPRSDYAILPRGCQQDGYSARVAAQAIIEPGPSEPHSVEEPPVCDDPGRDGMPSIPVVVWVVVVVVWVV